MSKFYRLLGETYHHYIFRVEKLLLPKNIIWSLPISYCFGVIIIIGPEEGGDMFLRNIYLLLRRQKSQFVWQSILHFSVFSVVVVKGHQVQAHCVAYKLLLYLADTYNLSS
jgi:hypothetical protein